MIHVPVPRRSRVEERRFRVKVRLGVLRLDLLHECGVLAHQRLDDLPHRREHPRGFDEQHLRDALGKVVEDALDEKLDEVDVGVLHREPAQVEHAHQRLRRARAITAQLLQRFVDEFHAQSTRSREFARLHVVLRQRDVHHRPILRVALAEQHSLAARRFFRDFAREFQFALSVPRASPFEIFQRLSARLIRVQFPVPQKPREQPIGRRRQ
mmetsp:Transcript_920/g.3852  ORF Transcript_920/g.3852 Transcript_920/m.3852 type:complete len:211 (+) Transcript_920:765-1397(+)